MKALVAHAAQCQRGIAAVELALVLPILLLLLAYPLYLGRVLWHYTVIERAAQDAARYLSTIPASEIKNTALAPAVAALANDIVAAEIAELAPGSVLPVVTITCDSVTCAGITTPGTVRVGIQVQVDDIFYSGVTGLSMPLTAYVSYPYLGR